MYARIPTFKVDVDKIDAAIHYFEDTSLPRLRDLHGFKGVTLLVDRERGQARVIGYFESRQDIDSSADTAKNLRAEFAEKLNAELVSLEIWEVAADEFPQAMAEHAGAASGRV